MDVYLNIDYKLEKSYCVSMSSIKSILKKHNLRSTRQRISLGELIFSEGNWHFTAEILKDKAQLKNLNISQATVYNVLNDF